MGWFLDGLVWASYPQVILSLTQSPDFTNYLMPAHDNLSYGQKADDINISMP